ncbi:uncharacterized protein BYT42DRAFT_388741 [Radiomyces spectabilis]|uniref:uncharacterized protein n=1 Tax=Radiomyces spectabilis TaxID=64574 RepID=UPI00221EA536|nr:uncharacterized protein BYT42DRAFT_388741 [Radiomyces spectabilis]KAI8376502.1 hypothetical protein BYT42DRAFT_388741 [Radiomyces spectabilis]
MLDHVEEKRSLKLKRLFRSNLAPLHTTGSSSPMRKDLCISPPIVQHSSSIYSLVSPMRSSFGQAEESYHSMSYHPLSPPPSAPRTHKTTHMVSPTPRTSSLQAMGQSSVRYAPSRPSNASSTSRHTHYSHVNAQQQGLKDRMARSLRRHSCSSAAVHKQMRIRDSSPPPLPTNKKQLDPSPAAAMATLPAPSSGSKSTPLRKVKTYNVQRPNHTLSSSSESPEDEAERLRKQKILEDLISGRRGSTLKLSLTPKVLS